jgi:protein ImuA
MQLISCHNGRLLASALAEETLARPKVFTTGLRAIDELLPHDGFARGAIHEVLADPNHGMPRFFALLLARSAAVDRGTGFQRARDNSHGLETRVTGAIVWCDPRGELYPPAVAAMGIPLDRLYVLHPKNPPDHVWALAECLRCKGVSATVAPVEKLSRIEARRLQLAAEQGGGAGILLRPLDRHASVYAAATRWLVAPMRGERTVQRWKVQLIHGHGGRMGQTVVLEHHRDTRTLQARETDPLRAPAQLADRPAGAAARTRASA